SCPALVASGLFDTSTFQTLKAFHTQSPGLPAPSGLPWVTFPHGRANPERVPPGREKGGGHLLCHPVWHALSASAKGVARVSARSTWAHYPSLLRFHAAIATPFLASGRATRTRAV